MRLIATGHVTFCGISFVRMQLKYLSSVALFGSNLKWSMVMTLPFVIANDNIGATGFFLPSDFGKVTNEVQFFPVKSLLPNLLLLLVANRIWMGPQKSFTDAY